MNIMYILIPCICIKMRVFLITITGGVPLFKTSSNVSYYYYYYYYSSCKKKV